MTTVFTVTYLGTGSSNWHGVFSSKALARKHIDKLVRETKKNVAPLNLRQFEVIESAIDNALYSAVKRVM